MNSKSIEIPSSTSPMVMIMVDVLNLIQADETDRVVERKEIPLFDNKAFREAVINASCTINGWKEMNL